jgi:hypothetical protein
MTGQPSEVKPGECMRNVRESDASFSAITDDMAKLVRPSAPTVSISVTPSAIAAGERATIAWNSTDATSCTATGGVVRKQESLWYRGNVSGLHTDDVCHRMLRKRGKNGCAGGGGSAGARSEHPSTGRRQRGRRRSVGSVIPHCTVRPWCTETSEIARNRGAGRPKAA